MQVCGGRRDRWFLLEISPIFKQRCVAPRGFAAGATLECGAYKFLKAIKDAAIIQDWPRDIRRETISACALLSPHARLFLSEIL